MTAHRPPRRARPGRIALWAVAACATPVVVAGQDGCEFGEGSRSYNRVAIPGGGSITYLGAPHLLCDDGVQIWADTAVAYSESRMIHLTGSVRYRDRTRELRSDTARYFSDPGRLQAAGHLVIRDEADGSRIENGALVYLRRTDFRAIETMTVTTGADGVRPRALLTPAAPDTAPAAPEPPVPYTVVADRIFVSGDSYMSSAGEVEIERDSLFAFADSVEYDETADHLVLEGGARVLTGGAELVGRVITIGSPGGAESRIEAVRDAVLTSEDMLLRSPTIVVFLVDDQLDRLVATPVTTASEEVADSADLARPVATVAAFEMTADSLEVVAPGEVVERIVAVGSARSVSTSQDSLNVEALPEVARSDWLRGDTVVVTLRPSGAASVVALAGDTPTADTAAGADTTAAPRTERRGALDEGTPASAEDRRDYEVDRIVARGNASSLYRLTPSDTAAVVGTDPPALHYVVGTEITVTMVDGEIDHLQVVGQTRGVHLEPLTRRSVADSVARPDSASLGRDTTRAAPPAQGAARRPPRRGADPPRPSSQEEPWKRS